jgi:holo-[acyl-carrier protein] synthase
VAKALGLEAWSWQDIEVVPGKTGPGIRLHGRLAELGAQVDISLTHSRTMAGAVAVLR